MFQGKGFFWLPTGAAQSRTVNLSDLLRTETAAGSRNDANRRSCSDSVTYQLVLHFYCGSKVDRVCKCEEKKFLFWKKIHHFSIYNYTLRAFYAQPHLSWIFCIIWTVSGDICRAHLFKWYRVSVFPLLNVVCILGEVPEARRQEEEQKDTAKRPQRHLFHFKMAPKPSWQIRCVS